MYLNNMIIQGNVTDVKYQKDNFILFVVNNKIKVKYTDCKDDIIVGCYIEAFGEFETSKYGRTFVVEEIEVSKSSIEKINLLSLYVKGMGKKKADLIEETLGKDYIKILCDKPDEIFQFFLTKSTQKIYEQWKKIRYDIPNCSSLIPEYLAKNIKGVSRNKANEWFVEVCDETPDNIYKEKYFFKYWASENANNIFAQIKVLPQIMNSVEKLQEVGFSGNVVAKIISTFKEESFDKIYENPYIAYKKFNVDFLECDDIALNNLDVQKENQERIFAGLSYIVQRNELEGNTFIKYHLAVEKGKELLEVSNEELIETVIKNNCKSNSSYFIVEDDRLYRRYVYKIEKDVAEKLGEKISYPSEPLDEDIKDYIASSKLTKEQKKCVTGLLEDNISILTGGPGTGKTTCINVVCKAIKRMDKTFLLAAPTGRASKRMSETTKNPSKTMHRLLEYQYMGNFGIFKKNFKNKLEADYIIIDETSMVDIFLMDALLKATPKSTHIILVGDVDQLPSISMGSILRDLKESGVISVKTLNEIHRQSKESYIVKNAYYVKAGHELEEKSKTDFKVFHIDCIEDVKFFINKVIDENKTFQVLCPTKVGAYGTEVINDFIQQKINGNEKKEIIAFNKLFKVGDKIIQTINDYEKEVFNGELGVIKSINGSNVTINFPQNNPSTVLYTKKDLKNIEQAYAITIHKSQGSEFDNVIIIIGEGNNDFITKELVYTGITRAKKGLILLTTKNNEYFKNLHSGNVRVTNLCNLLIKEKEKIENEDEEFF